MASASDGLQSVTVLKRGGSVLAAFPRHCSENHAGVSFTVTNTTVSQLMIVSETFQQWWAWPHLLLQTHSTPGACWGLTPSSGSCRQTSPVHAVGQLCCDSRAGTQAGGGGARRCFRPLRTRWNRSLMKINAAAGIRAELWSGGGGSD